MKNILSLEEINQYKEDGAVILRDKFDKLWIDKLRIGIQKAKNEPSPRLVSHTKEKDLMKQQGYNNGDKISGKMFPQLWSK